MISATLSHISTPLPLAMDLPSTQEVLDCLAGIEQELLRERQEKKDLETRLNVLQATTTGLMGGGWSPYSYLCYPQVNS